MFIKFEYLKFSGCLQDIRVFESFSDNVQVIMKIDDVLIPNFRMPTRIYEELENGGRYDFYGLVQKSKNKQKNTGFVMAVKAENGKVLEQASLKYTSQLGIWANGAVIAGVAFLISWIGLFFAIGAFDKSGGVVQRLCSICIRSDWLLSYHCWFGVCWFRWCRYQLVP